MARNTSLESFDNAGWKWQEPTGERKRSRPNRLLVHPLAGKRHLEMRVSIQFIGDNVEYAANPIVEDSGNHPNSDEAEIVESSVEGEKEFELDSSKCPSCRSDMDYEVVMECKEQICVVCLEENVTCLVSCTTYSDNHGMCKQFCYQKYVKQHNKVK